MGAYFTLESISTNSDPNFHTLRTRLIAAVNARLQNGEFTERGLAKILRVSQPQMHNVLKGTRKLQWDLADRLLSGLGIKLLDLLTNDELAHSERIQQLAHESPSLLYGGDTDASREILPKRSPDREMRVRRSHAAHAI